MSNHLAAAAGERYRLEQLLGKGGMGSVYRAYDRLIGRRVALKLVPVEEDNARLQVSKESPSPGDDTLVLGLDALAGASGLTTIVTQRVSISARTMAAPLPSMSQGGPTQVHGSAGQPKNSSNPLWARVALAQEFRTLASVRHPNIINVLDYGFAAQSQPFFTMELLENGRSLDAAARELPLKQKALLLAQLLRALSYLHRHGILHRDLKPTNVMVLDGEDGLQAKLLDFGLALVRSHAHAGDLAGTVSFMAPELFAKKPASEAADLFAFGVMAYSLFTGRHPFDQGQDEEKLIAAIATSEPDWEPLQNSVPLCALLRRLLAKSPQARPPADEALSALAAAVGIPVPQETAALRESTLQAARFVGREEPMAILRAAIDAARNGKGDVRLLAGESGVGKSRLMEELRIYSLVQGCLLARGQAVSEGGGAYGVWRDILRSLCLFTKLDELDAGVLKAVLPDLEVLLERAIPDAPTINPQATQLRLITAIESLILGQSTPLLLLLEDLHWADAESLALLKRLAPACRTRPILILASYRDDERPTLAEELSGCPVLKLSRLSASGISALCKSMLGEKECTEELVSFLELQTEGNVFFVIEVMRSLAEEAGQLSSVASHRLPTHVLTGGIQAIVQRRLSRLSEEARPMLRLAAVAGRQLDLTLLRRFEPRLEPWLYEAAAASVLEASADVWRFAHDKIRESLLLELEPSMRQRLHLLLAQALTQIYPGSAAHAAVLAEHYQRGGDAAQAAFYLVEAGVHALNQGATVQASSLLSQALLPEARKFLHRTQAARAYNGLIQAERALGRVEPCLAIYEQFMIEIGTPMPSSAIALVAEGSAMLGRWLRHAPAVTLATEEDRRMWSEVAASTRSAGEIYVWAGQPQKSMVAMLRGAELAETLDDDALRGYFLGAFSYLTGLVPLRGASQRFFEKGTRLLADRADTRARLDFAQMISARHMNSAEWELAKSQLESVIAMSRQVGDEYLLMFGLALRMLLSFRLNEDGFDSLGVELYERARRSQFDQFRRVYPLYQGVKALRRGDLELARRLLDEAAGYVQKSQDALGRVVLGGIMAVCLLRQEDKEGALRWAGENLMLVESTRFSNEVVGEGVAATVEAYLGLWEAGTADEKRKLDPFLRRAFSALRRCMRIFPSIAPRALLWHARDAWNQGAVRLARRLLDASQHRAARLKLPYDEALVDKWRQHFDASPPVGNNDLVGEVRGVLKLLGRGLR